MAETKITRRDMVEVENLTKKPFSKLFPDGEATALGTLAMAYVQEKKSGETDLSFDDWMDEEVSADEIAEEGGESEENPT